MPIDKPKTTVELKNPDESHHSNKDHSTLCELLAYMLKEVGRPGEYTLHATRIGENGSAHTKGVKIGPVIQQGIKVFYQPKGNGSRQIYYLISPPDVREGIKNDLDQRFNKALQRIPAPTMPKKKTDAGKREREARFQILAPAERSPHFIEGFSAANTEHALAFAQVAKEMAENYADAVLPKKATSTLLAEFLGLPGAFGVGSKLNGLISRGYLVKVGDSGYLVKTEDLQPGTSYRKASKKSEAQPTESPADNLAVFADASASKDWKPNDNAIAHGLTKDEDWVKGFVDAMLDAVGDQGTVAKSAVTSLIVIRSSITAKISTGPIHRDLRKRGYLEEVDADTYRVHGDPAAPKKEPRKSSTKPSGVSIVKQNGSPKPRITTAQFMATPEVRDEFLRSLGEQTYFSQDLIRKFQSQFANFSQNKCYGVLKALVEAGFLFKPTSGQYVVRAEKIALTPQVSSMQKSVEDTPDMKSPEPPSQTANSDLALAAKAIKKAKRLEAELESAQAEIAELKQQLATQPDIQAQIDAGIRAGLAELLGDD